MTISLVATSHGTHVPQARSAMSALVAAVRDMSPHLHVREAFVDVQEPRVDTAVDAVEGLAVVVPLLLSPGFHVRVDIRGAAERPWAVAAKPLGADRRITEVLVRRLRELGATAHDVVVLGAAGSTDATALQSVEAQARMLGAEWGGPVPVGYLGGAGVQIAAVVAEASRSRRRVMVVSYLMSPGFFHDRLRQCGADVVTRPLLDGEDVDPGIVSLVLDRFADAAAQLDWGSNAHAAVH